MSDKMFSAAPKLTQIIEREISIDASAAQIVSTLKVLGVEIGPRVGGEPIRVNAKDTCHVVQRYMFEMEENNSLRNKSAEFISRVARIGMLAAYNVGEGHEDLVFQIVNSGK